MSTFFHDELTLNLLCGLIGSVVTLFATTKIYALTMRKAEQIENRSLLRNGMKLLHRYAFMDKQIIKDQGDDTIDLQIEVIADFILKFGTENLIVKSIIEQIEQANKLANELYLLAINSTGDKLYGDSKWRNGINEEDRAKYNAKLTSVFDFNEILLDTFEINKGKFDMIKAEYYRLSKQILSNN